MVLGSSRIPGNVYLCSVQGAVARRVVFQMDQTAFADQKVLCHVGTSENAVKVQIWTAVSVYVLVSSRSVSFLGIVKKRFILECLTNATLYTLLQIF